MTHRLCLAFAYKFLDKHSLMSYKNISAAHMTLYLLTKKISLSKKCNWSRVWNSEFRRWNQLWKFSFSRTKSLIKFSGSCSNKTRKSTNRHLTIKRSTKKVKSSKLPSRHYKAIHTKQLESHKLTQVLMLCKHRHPRSCKIFRPRQSKSDQAVIQV